MKILAIDSSTKAASCAVVQDGRLLCFAIQSVGLTHSRTLAPMIADMLKNSDMRLSDMDAVAVAHGPGSFTGLRIGVSTAKGLCLGASLPAIGVSTLEAAAYAASADGVVLCALDARRGEVYSALFETSNGQVRRLTDDAALTAGAACDAALGLGRPIAVAGDAVDLIKEILPQSDNVWYNDVIKAPNAVGVALAAARCAPKPAAQLAPVYIRASQAEREAKRREQP